MARFRQAIIYLIMKFNSSRAFADKLDSKDPLYSLKEKFNSPISNPIYLCGHSLGLQPKSVKEYIQIELDSWSELGVDGHMNGENPWLDYHCLLTKQMSKIVGAKESETVVMNSLTTNLHLLMISFFKPTKEKYKIIIDTPSFPSDKYAVQSQLKLNGLDPENDLIEISTLRDDKCISNEEMLHNIGSNIDNVAMIMISGVNYYTGQLYDIESISNLAHKNNCIIGLDLAHAAGNVELKLNQWNIDFAAWCGYKYLNGGPGAPSGAYINENYHNDNLNRLEGWWGHDKGTRFDPPNLFNPIKGAEAWQLSNPPILSMAALRSAIKLFDEIGMNDLRKKSIKLTGYLESMIRSLDNNNISIITPSDPSQRGSQLSLKINSSNTNVESFFKSKNITCDFRKPNVIRAAPCAFYNSYSDVYNFVEVLNEL